MLPIDAHNLLSQMPAKMVGIAIVVAPLTQVMKRAYPDLQGWRALAMNGFLTTVAQLSMSSPDQVRTPAFWGAVFATSLTASGVHGVGKACVCFRSCFSCRPRTATLSSSAARTSRTTTRAGRAGRAQRALESLAAALRPPHPAQRMRSAWRSPRAAQMRP